MQVSVLLKYMNVLHAKPTRHKKQCFGCKQPMAWKKCVINAVPLFVVWLLWYLESQCKTLQHVVKMKIVKNIYILFIVLYIKLTLKNASLIFLKF